MGASSHERCWSSGWISPWLAGVASLAVAANLLTGNTPRAYAQTPVEVGFRDFSYGAYTGHCNSTPTGEKPESKLWFNDGFWWGSLCNDAAMEYHIYRLNLTTQTWVDTGTVLDARPGTKADTLWDGQHLYVVSHIFTTEGGPDPSPSQWGRLYRYSYDSGTKTYSRDAGFPVTVTQGESETLVVDKDSTGRLWVTYVENEQVMVNHSLGSDSSWGTPFVLPVTGATGLTHDDIASLISFRGLIGVMWSNQTTHQMLFAVHVDGQPDSSWQSFSAYAPGGDASDDHINLKALQSDNAGTVFAVVKTSFTSSSAPIVVLLVCRDGCTSALDWQAYTVFQEHDDATRPILLIDTDNRTLYVFATRPDSGGAIYYKAAAMDNIQFPTGGGSPFIQSSTDLKVNNPTSTKQNLNSSTGLVVLAGDSDSRYYLHNCLNLDSPPPISLHRRAYLPIILNIIHGGLSNECINSQVVLERQLD